jgi:hypothetical protein
MKRVIVVLSFLFISIGIQAQFFRPVAKDMFKGEPTVDRTFRGNTVILARPALSISAVQWNWDKEAKTFNAAAFQSIGLGAGLQHFVDTPDGAFNNYGANAMILLGTDISAAVTVSALNLINVGMTYNFSLKCFGILTGVQVKF